MRKWFASIGVLGLAATAATAQTIPGIISNFLFQVVEDDGQAETCYKLSYPSQSNEAFNVDFNSDGAGMTAFGLAVSTYSTSSFAYFNYVAICGDNLALDSSGRTPDIGSPLSILSNPTGGPGLSAGFCIGFTTYNLPDVNLGTGGSHGVVSFPTGDTNTWLCTDLFDSNGFNHTGPRHSFFTTDQYATPSSYLFSKWNWMIRLAGSPPTNNGGLFLVNGSTNAAVPAGGTLALQFWSADSANPTNYLELLKLGNTLIPLPPIDLQTGKINFALGSITSLGELSGISPCSAAGLSLDFTCYFSDNLDKKKNGKNKIKLCNVATANFGVSTFCNPNICFGVKDDGRMDSGIFNPRIWFGLGTAAGWNDVASVHQGNAVNAAPIVNNLTAVEAITWDFCGGNPCWQQVGIYQSNTTLDPSGNTPDMSTPLTSIGGSSACFPGLAYSQVWGFPATVYDTPDIAANTTTDYHSGMMWANADSCLYIGLDNNGTSDDLGLDCASSVFSLTGKSFYSLDGYATVAVPVGYNLCQRIDWN